MRHAARQDLLVNVVDAPRREPPGMVALAMLKELAARTPDIEVGYVRGRRHG